MKFGLESFCVFRSRVLISGKNTSIYVYAHTPIHILDHHLICNGTRGISTAWLQLFHSGVRLPCYHHPQGPHQGNDPASNQHTLAYCSLSAPCPPAGTRPNMRYFEPKADTPPRAPGRYTSCKGAQQLVAVKPKPAHRKWEEVLHQFFHSTISNTIRRNYKKKL